MDKRRLECFVALAEELHFARAASRSGISQPGLSQQLKTLEDQLQVRLLHRSKRHVSLTESGQVFLVEARKILAGMAAAVDLTRRTEDGSLGTLKIGTTPSALFIIMPEILLQFATREPGISLDVSQMTTEEQIQALRNGDIDVGLLHPPIDDRSLSCERLADQSFKVVLSAANPLAAKEALSLGDLAHETFVLFPRGVSSHLYDQIIALCHAAGFSPRKILEAAPAQSIVAIAACNLGIGFVAADVQHFDRPSAVFRPIVGPAPLLRTAVAWPRERGGSMAQKFIDCAVQVMAQPGTAPVGNHEKLSGDPLK